MNQNVYIDPTAVVDEGCVLGDGTRVWHFSHLMAGCRLGAECNVGQNVFIASGVSIGNRVKIQNNVSVYAGVACEDDVFLGPSVVFTNVLNPRSFVNRRSEYKPTMIRRGATIGANATIVCGHEIGAYSLVGAGSVVTHDVPPYSLVVGNPGRRVGWVSRHGDELHFDKAGYAVCPATQELYRLNDETVELVINEKE